jgi:hypothetical protein
MDLRLILSKDVTFEVELITEKEGDVDIQVVEGISVEKEQLFVVNNGGVRYIMKQFLYEKDIKEEIKRAFAIPSWQQVITFNPEINVQILVARRNKILWKGALPPASDLYTNLSDF